jgi:CarD family transcriptional regulator
MKERGIQMTSDTVTFQIGDKVVYAMHGAGQVKNILTRTIEGILRPFYHVVLDKSKGEVLVAVEQARSLGLRHAMQASEVPQAIRWLQQPASRFTRPGKLEDDYAWCKQRLRQGGAMGLAEVRRFLHDLEQIESFSNLHLRLLRTYVYAQLPAEISQALVCPLATAERLIDIALTSQHPVSLPTCAASESAR